MYTKDEITCMSDSSDIRLEPVNDEREKQLRREEAMYILIEFANADWPMRRQLLRERDDVLLNESVEQLLDELLVGGADAETVERLCTLLRRCRTWGVDAVLYFELSMRLGDNIEIPAKFEDTVMRSAMLLSLQRKEPTALEQAVEMMQVFLDRLTAEAPALFEAALLRDVADAMHTLAVGHPRRRAGIIEGYYREALPLYQEAQRPISVAFIQRALGEVLCEQGRYEEGLEQLYAAIDDFRTHGRYKNDIAWTLSSRATALDKLGHTEVALADFTEAIELLPHTAPLYRNRAETLIRARRLKEAEADLQRAVSLDRNEDSVLLWYRRAQLALARGDSLLAARMLDEVDERAPTYDVTFLRALCNWLLGDLDAARTELRQAFASAPPGERQAMHREVELLISENPEMLSREEMIGISDSTLLPASLLKQDEQ